MTFLTCPDCGHDFPITDPKCPRCGSGAAREAKIKEVIAEARSKMGWRGSKWITPVVLTVAIIIAIGFAYLHRGSPHFIGRSFWAAMAVMMLFATYLHAFVVRRQPTRASVVTLVAYMLMLAAAVTGAVLQTDGVAWTLYSLANAPLWYGLILQRRELRLKGVIE